MQTALSRPVSRIDLDRIIHILNTQYAIPKYPVNKAVNYYLDAQTHLAPTTKKEVEKSVMRFAEFIHPQCECVSLLRPMHIRNFVSHLQKTPKNANHPTVATVSQSLAPSTVWHHVTAVRTMANWWRKEPDFPVEIDLFANVHIPSPVSFAKVLTKQGFDKLLIEAGNWLGRPKHLRNLYQIRHQAAVAMLFGTACRSFGFCSLTMDRLLLTPAGYNITVIEKSNTRYGVPGLLSDEHFELMREPVRNLEARTIPVPDFVTPYLERWLEIRPKSDFVFTSLYRDRVGYPITTKQLLKLVNTIAKQAGISDEVNVKAFRHGSITHLLEQGVSLPIVSALAGHKDVAFTQNRYGHIKPEAMREATKNAW